MKKLLPLLALAATASCAVPTDASVTDLDEPTFVGDVSTEVEARPPDDVDIFLNTDGHPNIVRVCIDGVAFRTISTSHAGGLDGAVARVPEWDAGCPK